MSNAFALFFTVVAICLPIFIIGYYISNEDHWLESKFVARWGAVLEGTDTDPHHERKGHDAKWALFFPLMMLGRRILFTLTVFMTP